MEIADTFEFLRGNWTVIRTFKDHQSAVHGTFVGTAVADDRPIDPALDVCGRARYDERGELCFGSHIGEAHRRLRYERLADTTLQLYFIDDRPFIDLDLRTGTWHARHFCGEDSYEISTVVRTHNVIEEHWRVRGPATAYDATTTLQRVR